jgi:hypothetical protein
MRLLPLPIIGLHATTPAPAWPPSTYCPKVKLGMVGKIFVCEIAEAIRIRNDDRGEAAL